uniref:Uncharacterized protein n=1 Tax=Siphoviridae sp. ct2vX3 TaxID=2825318 RepID=A0A8S5PXA0_9CAUD|nr:MAG TPA: hypothetical protein [Siphoviridae sp. ct2vX3]
MSSIQSGSSLCISRVLVLAAQKEVALLHALLGNLDVLDTGKTTGNCHLYDVGCLIVVDANCGADVGSGHGLKGKNLIDYLLHQGQVLQLLLRGSVATLLVGLVELAEGSLCMLLNGLCHLVLEDSGQVCVDDSGVKITIGHSVPLSPITQAVGSQFKIVLVSERSFCFFFLSHFLYILYMNFKRKSNFYFLIRRHTRLRADRTALLHMPVRQCSLCH